MEEVCHLDHVGVILLRVTAIVFGLVLFLGRKPDFLVMRFKAASRIVQNSFINDVVEGLLELVHSFFTPKFVFPTRLSPPHRFRSRNDELASRRLLVLVRVRIPNACFVQLELIDGLVER